MLGGRNDRMVKLADYGRSKRLVTDLHAVMADADDDELKADGPREMRQHYAAPEILQRRAKWSGSVDVYSLGCVITRMGISSSLYASQLGSGHGWKGCSKNYPFPPEFDLDYVSAAPFTASC